MLIKIKDLFMQNNKLVLPISILIGAALIAAAIFLALTKSNQNAQNITNQNQPEQQEVDLTVIPAVTAEDKILGNPNADIVFIEYSDLDCPACKAVHGEFKKLIEKRGQSGEVAWVYRHLPITQLHPEAYKKAQASECVYKLGGIQAFWKFVDSVIESDKDDLPVLAQQAGVDVDKFNVCLADKNFAKEQIDTNIQHVSKVTDGGIFTPFIVLYVKSTGDKILIPGAIPVSTMEELVDKIQAAK